ncbi:hypothetical protein G4H71_18280 [Rhodococcus triatomae]|uniref:Trypsin n=1 Tax=Rhodococcus triatomae TaxID=300028 RepID=A0A1G8F129_9NOCA|nr:hypothetical protein [Rhodococcus triatomae]QNG19354.1 hypothetical protein G4H72_12095 [Rhodococcus triatomae]QNG24733.1 hypothetical protein G4H71_18280 [Rhodococcus triatomae]SDH75784.1 hypothetical protein SAMN05444695_103131 [Rhodococcus triatomae]
MLTRSSSLVLAALLAVGTSIGIATSASAQPTKTVHNAMRLALWPDWTEGQSHCSLGAVGTDKYGNDVGITAGHCWVDDMIDPATGQNLDDAPILDDIVPIWHADDLDWNPAVPGPDPIAYLRYYKDSDGWSAGHPGRDYAVMEFVDGVVLSSQGPHITMTGIHELPNGTIDSPFVVNHPATPQEKVLGSGLNSNNQLVVSGKIGVYYGRITNNSFTGTVGVYQSHAYHVAGDSGGPAVVKDPGVDYPSAGNGFQTAGTWAGITKAVIASWPAFSYTSSANILADLRARDEASGSDGTVFGAGFQVTSNP